MSLKNAWKGLIGKAEYKEDNRINHILNDEDRELGLKVRDMKREIKLLELEKERLRVKSELEELKSELYDNEDTSEEKSGDVTDTLLMSVLLPILQKNQSNNISLNNGGVNNSQSPPLTSPSIKEISDEEIRDFIEKQDKKHIKTAKVLPDTVLSKQIREKLGLNENETQRAIKILREEY